MAQPDPVGKGDALVDIVSVVIVTYQSENCLAACLQALEHSTASAFLELILVDNASTDATWSLVERYATRDDLPYQRVFTQRIEQNRGYAFANNAGLALSTGAYLLLLNPDTVVGRETIAACVQVLDRADRILFRGEGMQDGPRIGAVGCRLELPTGALDKACRRSFPTLWNSFCHFSRLARVFPRSVWFANYNLTYLDERGSYPVECVCGAFMLVSRQAYAATKGLDTDYFLYGEDIDWCYRIVQAGFTIWYEGSVTTLHLKGGNGGKRSATSLRHFYETMGLFYRKHYQKRYPLWVLAMVDTALRILYRLHVAALKRNGR